MVAQLIHAWSILDVSQDKADEFPCRSRNVIRKLNLPFSYFIKGLGLVITFKWGMASKEFKC